MRARPEPLPSSKPTLLSPQGHETTLALHGFPPFLATSSGKLSIVTVAPAFSDSLSWIVATLPMARKRKPEMKVKLWRTPRRPWHCRVFHNTRNVFHILFTKSSGNFSSHLGAPGIVLSRTKALRITDAPSVSHLTVFFPLFPCETPDVVFNMFKISRLSGQ